MDFLTGAAIAAAAAWACVIAAAVLPVPGRWYRGLRWVGAASIAVLGLGLGGASLPAIAPALVFGAGSLAVLAWPPRSPMRSQRASG